MRISANPNDPGYLAYKSLRNRLRHVHVFVDGIEQQHVVTADTKRSCVTSYETEADGRYSISYKRGTLRMKRIIGRVEIRMA